MKNRFLKIMLLFICLSVLLNCGIVAEAKICKRIQLKKVSQFDIKKADSSLKNLQNLCAEDGHIFFRGNNKDIKRTFKMSDINNYKNNYICKYNMLSKVISKRQFPPLKLWRKFGLLYGKNILLTGIKDVYIIDKKSLEISGKWSVRKNEIIIPVKNTVIENKASGEEFLVFQKGNKSSKKQIAVMNTNKLKLIHVSNNTCHPVIMGIEVVFGQLSKAFNMKVFDMHTGKITREVKVIENEIIKNIDKRSKIFFLDSKFFVGCSKSFYLINVDNSKLIWRKKNSKNDENYEYFYLNGKMLIKKGNEYKLFASNTKKFINRFNEEGSLKRKILYDRKNNFHLLFFDSNNHSQTRIILIDRDGKVTASFKRDFISDVCSDKSFLYFLHQDKNRIVISKERLVNIPLK